MNSTNVKEMLNSICRHAARSFPPEEEAQLKGKDQDSCRIQILMHYPTPLQMFKLNSLQAVSSNSPSIYFDCVPHNQADMALVSTLFCILLSFTLLASGASSPTTPPF